MLNTLYYSIIGEAIKIYYKIFKTIKFTGLNKKKRNNKIIVSLTSFGRRVRKTLPYTLISLLNQKVKPDRIICWLDKNNWNEANLPSNLSNLIKSGIEIRFCDDLRSYKKLLPTLSLCDEDDLIITVDDDVFYKPDLIGILVESYNKNPEFVHAFRTSTFEFEMMGKEKEYWCGEGHPYRYDFACGCGGVLYTKKLFYKDIDNLKLIQELAPKADDLWFYFMEYLNGVHVKMVTSDKDKNCFYPIDSFYQKFHSNASLNADNLYANGNNLQINNIMKHYGISIQQLKEFSYNNPFYH